jgi:hypothetical protein
MILSCLASWLRLGNVSSHVRHLAAFDCTPDASGVGSKPHLFMRLFNDDPSVGGALTAWCNQEISAHIYDISGLLVETAEAQLT